MFVYNHFNRLHKASRSVIPTNIYIHICISDNNKQKYTYVCIQKRNLHKISIGMFCGYFFLDFQFVFLQMPANNRSSRNLKSHFFLATKRNPIPNLWECVRFGRDLKFKEIQTGLLWEKKKQTKKINHTKCEHY